MKVISKRNIKSSLLVFAGIMFLSIGSYQTIATTISCSFCSSSTNVCNSGDLSPAGQPSCLYRGVGSCNTYACRRCDGTFASSVKVCIASPTDNVHFCHLIGEDEPCGTKYKRTCEVAYYGGGGSYCRCPESGGDDAGTCLFKECDYSGTYEW